MTRSTTAHSNDQLSDILYADDTLLLGVSPQDVEALAAAVETHGAQYGLTLHWGRTQAIAVANDVQLKRPDGTSIPNADSLIY